MVLLQGRIYIIFEIPRKRPNEQSECELEQSTY